MSKKTAQKIALVAKRLSMLKDDSQSHDFTVDVSEEIPLQLKSNLVKDFDEDSPCDSKDVPLPSNCSAKLTKHGSHKRSLVVSDEESDVDRKMQLLIRPVKKQSTNPIIDLDEDSPCDSSKLPVPSGHSANETKQKSHKQAMVVRDGGPEVDGKMQLLIQPIEKGRIGKIVELPDNLSEEKLSTSLERAIEIQASLSAAYPSFVKQMLPSHVSGGFWLHLSAKFCDINLPKDNCIVMLVDEAGIEFKTTYLAHKKGLSGGWRAFSIHHKLQKGDVLVFHLIHPTTFKVYIVREHILDDVDGALVLQGLDTCAGHMISGENFQNVLHTEDSPSLDSESPNNSDTELQPEVLDGICFSDSSNINFEAIEGFENFAIIVDNLAIDSKFSNANRKKYYELCCSQNSFLHQKLLQGLNCNLVVGMILETINIADAIKACSSSTSTEDLQIWKTTLSGFELLGMNVNFMCTKLNHLLDITLDIKAVNASDRSNIFALEQAAASSRMQTLENQILDLKGVMENIDLEIEAELTASVRKHKSNIKEISNISW